PRCLAPRHPRHILFPYTTLFRSTCIDLLPPPAVGRERYQFATGATTAGRVTGATTTGRRTTTAAVGPARARLNDSSRRPPRLRRDRKSTRLNSSHVAISYAVFCL